MSVARIHFTGGPGSGKTTAARHLGELLQRPVFSLDYFWLDTNDRLGKPDDYRVTQEVIRREVADYASGESWLSEGAFLDWTEPLLERADVIVWMQAPWPAALYRIVVRHIRAEIARNNRFPGWVKLAQFWAWSGRYYANRNAHGLNIYGNPETFDTLKGSLSRYTNKITICRNLSDVQHLVSLAEVTEA